MEPSILKWVHSRLLLFGALNLRSPKSLSSGDHTVKNDPEAYYNKESGHKNALCAHFTISDWFITS